MSFNELLKAFESQKKRVLEMADGKERLENVTPSPVLLALELELPYDIIEKLINNGADIREKGPSLTLEGYDRYPLSVALDKDVSLDCIKLLYNTGIPPIHIIGVLNLTKPSDEIVKYLLEKMDNYLDQDDYIKGWNELKWDAKFWNRGILKQQHIILNNWNPSAMEQVVGRAVRFNSHINEPFILVPRENPNSWMGKSFDIPEQYPPSLKDIYDILVSSENKMVEILDMANGERTLHNIKPSPIFLALELEFPYDIIEKLVNKGADITTKNEFERYPLNIALENKLSLDYVKLLWNEIIPSLLIMEMLDITKPCDEITEFLLSTISCDKYLKEWKLLKWNAPYWDNIRPLYDSKYRVTAIIQTGSLERERIMSVGTGKSCEAIKVAMKYCDSLK